VTYNLEVEPRWCLGIPRNTQLLYQKNTYTSIIHICIRYSGLYSLFLKSKRHSYPMCWHPLSRSKKVGTRADSCPIPASIPHDGCSSWLRASASGYARAADAPPTLVPSAPVLCWGCWPAGQALGLAAMPCTAAWSQGPSAENNNEVPIALI
jgi:hypothetical protein